MARASASWASSASFRHWALPSAASVTTTPKVVLPKVGRVDLPSSNVRQASAKPPASSRAPATTRPSRSTTSPRALTTASAPTVGPPGSRTTAVPTPPRLPRSGPRSLPTVAPVPAPTAPSAGGPLRAPTRGVALVRPGEDLGRPHAEVEDGRRGHDRDPMTASGEAHLPLAEVAHDPIRRPQAEGRPPAEADRVHPLDQAARAQQVGLPGGGGGAANLHAGHRPLRGEEHHRAASARGGVGPMANPDPGDLDDAHVQSLPASGPASGDGPGRVAPLDNTRERGSNSTKTMEILAPTFLTWRREVDYRLVSSDRCRRPPFGLPRS